MREKLGPRIATLFHSSGIFVRVDAHIDPLGTFEFAGDFRKYSLYCRGDVGIAPTNTPEVPKKLVGADASVRPWEVSNSPEIFVKKQIFLRADRVVRPYEHYGSSVS